MHGRANKFKDDVIVTKVDASHPIVKQLNAYYKSKGEPAISMYPDWVIIKFSKGSPIYLQRFHGNNGLKNAMQSVEQLSKELEKAKKVS